MLKKLRGVRFAGIDAPDDVVNLTHQELFVKGGFVVFDRATLESLSLCMSICHAIFAQTHHVSTICLVASMLSSHHLFQLNFSCSFCIYF